MSIKKILPLAVFVIIIITAVFSAGCSKTSTVKMGDSSAADSASGSAAQGNAPAQEDKTGTETIKDVVVPDNAANNSDNDGVNESAEEENSYQLEYTLSELGDVLKRGMYFIVGNKAPAMDIVTISEIKSDVLNKGIETGDARLADEVDDYTAEDYIVIGSPCDNPVAAELLAKEIAKKGSCNIFEPGTAWIKLFKTSPDNIALYVGGGNAVDTRKAGKVVGNFNEHNLQGTTVEVSGSSTNPTLNLVIG